LVKVVSFDVWNTLLRLDRVYVRLAELVGTVSSMSKEEALNKILKAYKEAKKLRRLGKVKASEVVERSRSLMAEYLGLKEEVLTNLITKSFLLLKTNEVLIEDVPTILKYIKKLGLRTVILGNVLFWPSTYTRKLLESVGISKYFDAQFYADEVGVQKPDSKAFLIICKVLSVEPEEVIHVGDGISEDLGGALSVGFKAVLISDRVEKPISIGDSIHIIPHIRHLINVIKLIKRE